MSLLNKTLPVILLSSTLTISTALAQPTANTATPSPTASWQPPAGSRPLSRDQRLGLKLRQANLGASDSLQLSGGYVSYGTDDHFGLFGGDYTHYFYHRVVHSISFGGAGLMGQTLTPDYSGATAEPELVQRDVRFYYGQAGVDLTITRWLGFETTAIFGVTDDGVGGGAQGVLRIGLRDGVNVRAGGWLRSYIGHEGFLSVEIPVGRYVKLAPRVVIDNMPSDDQAGFRALLRGEVRLGRHLGLAAEIGGAARDTRTGGVLGSLGLTAYL